jgi:hypothetical protein
MKVSTEIDNNFGYEKITQLVDNIPLIKPVFSDHLFYVTLVQCSLERSHTTGYTVTGKNTNKFT